MRANDNLTDEPQHQRQQINPARINLQRHTRKNPKADPVTLLSILTTGATVVAQPTIEEAMREAWQGMKAVIQDVFGRRTSGSLAKLEAVERRPEGRSELFQLLGPIDGPDVAAIVFATERLMGALCNDPGAQEVMARNDVNLDLDVGRDVLLQRIHGVHGINI